MITLLLQVENVTSGYDNVPVIHDVSIMVDSDEIVTIIGPNGSGKSTLLKTIFGLTHPMNGSIRLNSTEITNLDTFKIAKAGVGYVPQVENIFPNLMVTENLEMGAFNRKNVNKKDLLTEVSDIFPILQDRKNEKAGNLSGGERQMLAIARAMVSQPYLLLLDEPTASLAPNLVSEIIGKLEEIRKKDGTSILLVEQNALKSLKVSDRGYVLVTGKKIFEGDAKTILENKDIGKLYLGIKK